MVPTDRNEERVLILAPTGRDGFLVCEMLERAGVAGEICASVADLTLRLRDGAGLALLTEEALNDAVENLFTELKAQPAWSDLPLLLLTGAGASLGGPSARLMELFGDSANITLLERPVRVTTLLSVVRSALRARRRQYEVRDYIAERKQTEEDLRQTQKLESIGVLAGGVAHDFNNLLVGILGNASLATEMLPPDDAAIPLLHDVILAGQRAADLTRQLLAYSGKGRFIVKPVDLSQLVREISALIQPSIPKLVRLRLNLSPDLPPIEADSSQLQQLVMNLVINGAEAIGEKAGAVEVTTSVVEMGETDQRRPIPPTELPAGRYVLLEVSDDGGGMDQATLSRIFDPFFTTKFTGSGLGLAAALGIVRGHRGGIEVDSAPGQGASFRAYFPVMEGRETRHLTESAYENLAGAGVVLFVDDEEMVRSVARNCLERYGYTVLLAEDGRRGVEVFEQNRDQVALVILDMTMPVMGGEDALREMRKIRRDVKIILSSGYNEAEAVRRFTGRELTGFLQKPYRATDLAQKVKEALGSAQAKTAL